MRFMLYTVCKTLRLSVFNKELLVVVVVVELQQQDFNPPTAYWQQLTRCPNEKVVTMSLL